MDLGAWTWLQITVAIAAYWIILTASWVLYRSRPARQAQARAAARVEITPGATSAQEVHIYSAEINVLLLAAVVLAPPSLLLLAWLVL